MPEKFEDKKYSILYAKSKILMNLAKWVPLIVAGFFGLFFFLLVPNLLFSLGVFVFVFLFMFGIFSLQKLLARNVLPKLNNILLTRDCLEWRAGGTFSMPVANIKYLNIKKIKIADDVLLEIHTENALTPYFFHAPIENFSDFISELRKRFKSATSKEIVIEGA